jgi:hypothetical protein
MCHWRESLWEEVRESVVVVQLKHGTAPQLMSSSRCTSTRTSRHVSCATLKNCIGKQGPGRFTRLQVSTILTSRHSKWESCAIRSIRVSGRVRRRLKQHLDIFRRKRPDTTPWPTLLTLEAPRKARPWIRTWYRECSHWLVSRNPRGPRRHEVKGVSAVRRLYTCRTGWGGWTANY